MSANILQIPPINEIRFSPEGVSLPSARYHQLEFNQGMMYELLQSFQKKREYFIRKQNNDRNCIQIHTNAAYADVELRIYDKDMNIVQTLSPTVQAVIVGNTEDGVQLNTFQWNFLLSTYITNTQGKYHYVIVAEWGGTTKYYLSEPIWVKNDWKKTLLIEYFHDRNDFYIIWSLGTRFSRRVGGYWIEDDIFEEDTEFKDQNNINRTLSTDLTSISRIELDPIPVYLLMGLKEAFRCKTVTVESWRITKASGATWEAAVNDASNLRSASIKLNYYSPKDTFTFKTGALVPLLATPSSPTGILDIAITSSTAGSYYLLSNTVIEDGADAITKVAAMNATALALGLLGTVTIAGGFINYQNHATENFTLLLADTTTAFFSADLDLPTANGVYTFSYKSFGPGLVDWGDGNIFLLAATTPLSTKTHTYQNVGADTKTVRIFHSDLLNVWNSNTLSDTAKLVSITGTFPAAMDSHTLMYNLDPGTTNWDFTYLENCAGNIQLLTLRNTAIETIVNPFNGAGAGGFSYFNYLKTIDISNNKLTAATIEDFYVDFVANANYAGPGYMYSNAQTPAVVYTAPTIAAKITLANAGWITS